MNKNTLFNWFWYCHLPPPSSWESLNRKEKALPLRSRNAILNVLWPQQEKRKDGGTVAMSLMRNPNARSMLWHGVPQAEVPGSRTSTASRDLSPLAGKEAKRRDGQHSSLSWDDFSHWSWLLYLRAVCGNRSRSGYGADWTPWLWKRRYVDIGTPTRGEKKVTWSWRQRFEASGQGTARMATVTKSQKSQEGFLPGAFGGSMALLTPGLWTCSHHNCERIHFCCCF